MQLIPHPFQVGATSQGGITSDIFWVAPSVRIITGATQIIIYHKYG